MNDWQPISTAPMNGTPIIVFLPESINSNDVCGYMAMGELHIVVAWWHGSGWECGFCYEGSADTEGYSSAIGISVKPSHWMPLPEAPTR